MSAMSQHYERVESTRVGVGLRHEHYNEALTQTSHSVDFLEIHAENFFAEGGMIPPFLEAIAEYYPLSIHGTAMGLGSASGVDSRYLKRFCELVNRVNPILVSDHACFTWGQVGNQRLHAGDLLPITYNRASLDILVDNIDLVQQALGRQLLIENIVSYVDQRSDPMHEAEFLAAAATLTGCGLLVDLNNVLVNGRNFHAHNLAQYATTWLKTLPTGAVKEIHLAGSSEVQPGELIVDDHSQPVSHACWALYQQAIHMFPGAATLIEWDNQLPTWERLQEEAGTARFILAQTLMEAMS
ncbi:DUF692 domain-containing protein [Aestuariibacter sp. GS-14]|uniref:DUF692 domain-containing protein n=1 Tax=Aestuariibacter sp. GS-14 TaxID=2590670 RepID=UPI00112AC7D5|nr:DUF692 domain-containing protein [Aestuariibacter sp. GS-14]TPV62244.1 DUF692 domain-containing protein [Aestuariibacter sp. GS-14]